MGRYAKVIDGVVTNVISADADFASAEGLVEIPREFGVKDKYADGVYSKDTDLVEEWAELRATRNALLESTDYLMIADVYSSLSSEDQAALTVYRQALRDVPQNTTDPRSADLPKRPENA